MTGLVSPGCLKLFSEWLTGCGEFRHFKSTFMPHRMTELLTHYNSRVSRSRSREGGWVSGAMLLTTWGIHNQRKGGNRSCSKNHLQARTVRVIAKCIIWRDDLQAVKIAVSVNPEIVMSSEATYALACTNSAIINNHVTAPHLNEGNYSQPTTFS